MTDARHPIIPAQNTATRDSAAVPPGTETLEVEIVGAVKQPGIYVMSEGESLEQLIRRSGGLAVGAKPGLLDFSQTLLPGMRYEIPWKLPEKSLIDVNAADAERLQDLRGIGPVLAERIIAHRKEHGPFETLEALMEVSGIGPVTYDNIRNHIRVSGTLEE